jgi:hypothetical protein
MFRIETRNKPRGHILRNSEGDFCVRVYKNDPTTINLQICAGKRWLLVSLSKDEAIEIADRMYLIAGDWP